MSRPLDRIGSGSERRIAVIVSAACLRVEGTVAVSIS
jgi:hypothetical protein